MNIPKIGLRVNRLERILELRDEICAFELNDVKEIGFDIKHIIRIKDLLKGFDLSWHSKTSRVFSCVERGFLEFNKAEINFMISEIIIAGMLGVKEFIFHLKQTKLNDEEKKIIREVIDFAMSKGIVMIYESNKNFSADTTFDFLDNFRDVGYNLDIGHLNTALFHKTLGMDVDEFIDKIKDRVVFIHAHNNYGEKDDHFGLLNGSLDWRGILDKIDLLGVRKIVLEVRDIEEAKESHNFIKDYLNKRYFNL